jgi:carboxypeptidase Q
VRIHRHEDSTRLMRAAAWGVARLVVVVLCGVLFDACGPRGASPPLPAPTIGVPRSAPAFDARSVRDTGAIGFLVRAGADVAPVAKDFEYLTDVIGPRLTGGAGVRRANEWTRDKMLSYGADSAALEAWPFGIGWTRGPLTMRLLAPHERQLIAVSWGWAPGTDGPRAGDVVYVDARSRADFEARFTGKLRGAWVMAGKPFPRANPDATDPVDSMRIDSLRKLLRVPRTSEQTDFLQNEQELLAAQGIAGQINDGGKEYGLLTMSGSPDDVSPFPQVVVANSTFSEFHRLLAAGERVRVEVNASNTFGRDTLVQWNTIGEIHGTDRASEVVLIGAHLDSWDLGTGATDNGAGAIAVLEAARLLGALKASGVRPRRSIRFVLFTGEEQGLYGSQYYALTHREELPKYQAVLVLDNGTGRITGVGLQGWDELKDLWTEMMAPISALGPLVVKSEFKTGTDHLAFLPFGVPSFNYDQIARGYDHTHHSQADVFDQAVPKDVAQAATVMAVNAWQLANLPTRLPRRTPSR